MMILKAILVAVIAYLLGSISVGMITSKLLGGPNLRDVGSGNTGATNALRAMGLKGGIIVFVGDILKALIASIIGALILGFEGKMIAALFVIIGHSWPCFFQFKGGKGVSSTCGAIFLTYTWQAIICYILTLTIIGTTKYVSLGSICLMIMYAAAVIITEAVTGFTHWLAIPIALCMAALVIWRHKENIKRLLSGTERKLVEKK